ncbi:MAG: flagellar export chaperone FlgN [Ignavibacteriae bacterium]|nr:flagellar export chaperone FlgN [Ignavibacteriota bacterium]
MNNLVHLAEVIATEAELTEQLIEMMKRQQLALMETDAETVAAMVDNQEELLLPIEGLEQERIRLTREVWNEIASRQVTDNAPVHLSALIERLPGDEAQRLSSAGSRLHTAVVQMLKVNQANQFLIEHSRRFIRDTFRIVTDGYSRQLIDHRI